MTRRRVLVVDDDPDILESLSALLEDRYEVLTARNGVEALALVDRADAVLLDLMMPVLGGEGVLAELARRGGGPPVLVMSAWSDLKERARGAADWLRKPFAPELLDEKLARLLAAP